MMTTTAITFEVDGLALALPDASGLTPLTLPAPPALDAAPSQAAVDRFQAAMQEDPSTQQALPQEAPTQDNAAKTAVLLMQLGTPNSLGHTHTQQENTPTAQPTAQPPATTTTENTASAQNAGNSVVTEVPTTTATAPTAQATTAPAPEAKQTASTPVAQTPTVVTTETALPAEPPQVVEAAAAPVAKNNITPSTATTYTAQTTTPPPTVEEPVSVPEAVVASEVVVEPSAVSSKTAVVASSFGKDVEKVEDDSDFAEESVFSAVGSGSSSGVQVPANAVQAAVVSPVSAPAFDDLVNVSEGPSGAGMTSAQIEELVETVAAQIRVERSLQAGEGTVTIQLKPAVLEGSQISLSAKDGALSVEIAPSSASVAERLQGAVPRLEAALAGHVAEFHSFSVTLRKGRKDETA